MESSDRQERSIEKHCGARFVLLPGFSRRRAWPANGELKFTAARWSVRHGGHLFSSPGWQRGHAGARLKTSASLRSRLS